MRNIITFVISVTILILGFYYIKNNTNLLKSPTAYAVGDLNVDFESSNGSPIFTIANAKPGDNVTRNVKITNNADTARPIGIKGSQNSSNPSDFNTQLFIAISENGNDIYGGTKGNKTLKDFFDETAGVNGVSLGTIDAGEEKTFSITITFDPNSGNAYQNAVISFNLNIGIQIDLPQKCENIKYKNIIYGTSKNDRINAGSGNTLIVGFEGNDNIFGGSGNDCIIDGNGSSKISGGSGNDVITVGIGNNKIDAGSGNDTVIASEGNNNIKGGSGNDNLDNGSVLSGKIDGGSGSDICIAQKKTSCEK